VPGSRRPIEVESGRRHNNRPNLLAVLEQLKGPGSTRYPKDSRNIIGKQKSSWLSRCVRSVIADHSPERVLETGLLMKAPEKNPPDEREVAL